MTFDFDGINIDMLFATLPMNTVPEDVDIDDDEILQGVDESTEKSLNGPRVTNLLHSFVMHNYEPFLTVLRFARVWAKRRGIYSNKLGYLGGINFNILVALVCQVFPKATPSYLLTKFFHIFAAWDWPSPALLCAPVDAKVGGFEVWGASDDYSRGHHRNNLMPIITPAYPAMNSAANVNPMTFGVLREEFERASRICKTVVSGHAGVQEEDLEAVSETWGDILAPSDFFERYDAYLALNVLAHKDAKSFDDWKGFFSSRLRKFVERLAHLPFKKIHLFPKEFPQATTEGLAPFACSYFVGVVVDHHRLGSTNKALVLTHVWAQFWNDDMVRFNQLDDSLDLRLEHLKWAELPDFLFPSPDRKAELAAKRKRERRAARRAVQQPAIAGTTDAAKSNNKRARSTEALDTGEAKKRARTADQEEEDEDEDEEEKKEKEKKEGEEAPTSTDLAASPSSEALVAGTKSEEVPEEEPEPLSLQNLPSDLPRLRAVVPSWHPLASSQITLLKPILAIALRLQQNEEEDDKPPVAAAVDPAVAAAAESPAVAVAQTASA